jgi:hypothetical protein
MYQDFKELLRALNAHNVEYLIVGGYAVSWHAGPRATKDLDILVRADASNSVALFAALAEFGAPLEGLAPRDFTEPGAFFRMGTPPVMVDILPRISGVEFADAWQRRVDVAVDDGLTVPFISRADLLAAKLAAARPQDLADVAALRAIEDESSEHHAGATSPLSADDTTKIQRKAREDWLRSREQQGQPPDPEETQAKAREAWLKIRRESTQEPSGPDAGHTRGSDSETLGTEEDN